MIDISYPLKAKPSRTLIYWALGIALVLFAVKSLTGLRPGYEQPTFQYNLIETAVENKPLMNQIGGYNTHKFSYSSGGLDSDSIQFELLIYGGSNILTYTGWASKAANKGWQVRRIDSVVSHY
ncbi:hypothetical protein [Spirosoma sp.]|uniref:hypothetical protein n=1 Tax=Spirosoma sp. TaxID=1899569 RepID=UPI003B3BA8DE